ncbi:hypothetical protein CBS101457_004522 [Exobasidium rhododendri]|nr:hypothetical protein CBS101457_004522 [Exobasidium rhododendri]
MGLLIIALAAFQFLGMVCHAMGVVGIDYGTESMKVSLVKPGQPFDVVLSRDSKRKISSAVAWKVQERMFGTDAVNLATRYPGDTFMGAKFLLGRASDDEQAKSRQQRLLGTKLTPTRLRNGTTVSLQRETDYTINKEGADTYSVEEVVGMQLGHAKMLAEEQAGEEVMRTYPGNIGSYGGLDVVITVPIFFTTAERQSILDAANIAGMRPKLVSDGAAVAVNYAMSRTFPKPEKHLFFDSGAGSTTATLVQFSTKTVQADSILSIGNTQKEAVVVEVIASGWDRDANGLALDLLIRDALADQFESKHGSKLSKPIREQPRSMARLLKESNRVKHILSANTEANSAVEGLAEEIDFRGKLSREELESLVHKAGLKEKFSQPLRDVLKESGLSMKDISSVVLVGGMTRVPLVQAALQAAGVPDEKIAQNVNADEAAVMGAAFYGASFNPQFRMKSIKAYDGNPFPVVIRDASSKDEVIFPKGSFEKLTHFKEYVGATSDFTVDLAYSASISADQLDKTLQKELYTMEISEIDSYLNALKEKGEIDMVETTVNVTLESKILGIYQVESAWLNVKQKHTGVVGALKSFFNVGANAVLDDDQEDDDSAANEKEASVEGNEPDKTDNSSAKPKKEKSKKSIPTERSIKLVGRVVPRGSVHPLSNAELKESRDRLYVADSEARSRATREEARNVLEAYVYRVRDLVEEEWFKKASRDEERKSIESKTKELSSWLSSAEGDKAVTSTLKLRKGTLEGLVEPVEKRVAEQRIRGKAIRSFEKSQKEAREFLQEARANLTVAIDSNLASKYTVSELDSFQTQLDKDRKWFDEKMASQEKRKLDEDVVIKSEEIEKRAKKSSDTVTRYKKRRIPKTRPAKKEKESPKPAAQEEEQPQKEKNSEESSHPPPRHEEL